MAFDPLADEYLSHYEFIQINEFTIYDTTKMFTQSNLIKQSEFDNLIKEIHNYKKEFGVIISTFEVEEKRAANIFIFDKIIIIVDRIHYSQFLDNVKKIVDHAQIIFFNNYIQSKNVENSDNSLIIKQIVAAILYRSKIRTKRRHAQLNDNFQTEINKFTDSDSFYQVNSKNFINLCFNKNDQFLYILKAFQFQSGFQNESYFYETMDNKCLFIPKYFGTVNYNKYNCIIIEYIEGITLNSYNSNIAINDKIKSIMQLLIAFECIHLNKFFLSDLNANNILIDENNDLTLIDFDHSKQKNGDNLQITGNIGSVNTVAPEQRDSNKSSSKSDIFSIGRVISKILTGEFDGLQNITNCSSEMQKFKLVFAKCTEENPKLRLSITTLISKFFHEIGYNIITSQETNENKEIKAFLKKIIEIREKILHVALAKEIHSRKKACNLLMIYCFLYYFDVIVPRNTTKAYNYVKILEKYNHPTSKIITNVIFENNEFDLKKAKDIFLTYKEDDEHVYYEDGMDFYELCKYDQNWIKFAISSLEKGSIQNDPKSNLLLAQIYYENKYITQNIDKCIYYLNLSIEKKYSEAQYFYGLLLYKDPNLKNINRSLYYLKLSSDQNNSNAQFYLGLIFYIDKSLRDVDKSMQYLKLSADQNNSEAQFLLGLLYYTNKHFIDNTKSFQNETDFYQYVKIFLLNEAYRNNDYSINDVIQAIQYLKQSANQNNMYAKLLLFSIYVNKIYIPDNFEEKKYFINLFDQIFKSCPSPTYLFQLLNAFPLRDNPNIQCILGEYYYKGIWVRRNIDYSLFYLNLAAEQKHSHALYLLGEIYFYGNFVEQNIQRSIYYFTKSSEYGDPESSFALGLIYYEGYTGKKDIDNSIKYLKVAAEKNHSQAQFLLGKIYYKREKIDSALDYLKKSAKQDNSDAQCLLGEIYFKGLYVVKDIQLSKSYLERAVKTNNSNAQYLLGIIYISLQLYDDGIHYLTLSLQQNNPIAQYIFGIIYYRGISPFHRDINKSIHYLTLSSNQNNSNAQLLLGEIYYDGIYVKKDINKSVKYLSYCASSNNSRALYLLGYIYISEKEFNYKTNLAISYLQSSAKQQNADASFLLGKIYYFSINNIQRDMRKSIEYFTKSSNFNTLAKNFLGVIYKNGDGVEKNTEIASCHFEEAIKKDGCLFAYYNLARIYYFGNGVEKNISDAIVLLKDASKNKFLPAILFLCSIISFENLNLEKENCNFLQFDMFNFELFKLIIAQKLCIDDIERKIIAFLKEYDLLISDYYNNDLLFFLKFGYLASSIKNNVSNQDKSQPINKSFYKGFYD